MREGGQTRSRQKRRKRQLDGTVTHQPFGKKCRYAASGDSDTCWELTAGEEESARASEKGAWACWECDDESEEGLRSIGRRVGEEDGGPGPPVLAEEGRIGDVDV